MKLALSRADVVFNARAGAALMDSAIVSVTASSGAALDELTAVVTSPAGSSGSWLTASLDQTRLPAKLTLRARAGSLQPGEYTAMVKLRAPGAEAESLQVTTRVMAGAGIGLNASKICFTLSLGDAGPRRDDVRITSVDGSVIDGLTAAIVYDQGQPTGWLGATFDVTTAPARLWLQGTPGSLPAGIYSATVNVASARAGNSPVPIRVTMSINQPIGSRLFVSIDWEGTATGVGGLARVVGSNGIYCPDYSCVGYLESGIGDISVSPDFDNGVEFRRWSGACEGSGECTVHFSKTGTEQTVHAVFRGRPTYVTLGLRGDRASGTVTVSPPVTTIGTGAPLKCRLENGVAQGKCEGELVSGAGTFTITATPDPGSVFVYWQVGGLSGDRSQLPSCAPTTPTCTFTLTTNGNYVDGLVTFASAGDRSLEVQVQGEGHVSWPYPPGGDCPLVCKQYFETGSTVTLRASPDEHMIFAGWTDCPVPAGASCTLPMTVDRVVGARFAAPSPATTWELVVNPSGIGAWGLVSLQSDAGANHDFCIWSGDVAGGPCRVQLPLTVLEARLTAVPAGGSQFVTWRPDCPGGSGTECVVRAPAGGGSVVTVEAEFASLLPPNVVHVTVLGEGATGYVEARLPGSNPEIGTGFTCYLQQGNMSGRCDGTSGNGRVEFRAIAGTGSRFVLWSGACTGTDPLCVLDFTGGQTANIVASFAVSN